MKKHNRTKYTVLGMLTIAPMSGYEITKTIRTSTSFFWSESEGQIYPVLGECLKLGLTTCQEDSLKETQETQETKDTQGTYRSKKIYKITAKGKKELIVWLSEKVQPSLIRNELLLKLFFGNNSDIKENIHHVMNHEKEIRKLIKIYKNLQESLIAEEKGSPHLRYWLITLNYGIKLAKAELNWCQETLVTLDT